MLIEVVGVYPVEAPEPCHLVEPKIQKSSGKLDLNSITQEIGDQSPSSWQAPYDEVWLSFDGEALANHERPEKQPDDSNLRFAFYFHYLDFSSPLLTPAGPVTLPSPTEMPTRLGFLRYEPPC